MVLLLLLLLCNVMLLLLTENCFYLFIYVTVLRVQAHWWWWWHAVFSRCGCDVSSSIITSVVSKATYRSTTKNIYPLLITHILILRDTIVTKLMNIFCMCRRNYLCTFSHTHTSLCIIIILCCVRTFFFIPSFVLFIYA